MPDDRSQPKSSSWLRAADAGLTAAGLILVPLTGGVSAGAGAAAKAAAKKAAAGRLTQEASKHPEVLQAVAGLAVTIFLAAAVMGMTLFTSVAAVTDTQPNYGGYRSGKPTAAALTDIPAEYIPIFLAAQEKYGVSWAVLAAVAGEESGFGQSEVYLEAGGVSSAGAVGFMQFMPDTWEEYAVDGDGNGVLDPYNPWDAVFSAARFLAANGFAEDARAALYRYNRSTDYVDRVLKRAAAYSDVMLPVGRGMWPLPAEYREISSGFGWRLHPVYHSPNLHEGIDIPAPEGTPVLAASDGVVAGAGQEPGYGLVVRVRHAGGAETLYGHLSTFYVVPGQQMAAGEPLGAVGSTGVSTGPHLHFGVYVHGQAVNPEEWLVATENGG